MPQYIGAKTLRAQPMTRGDYNAYRGWKTPANEGPLDAGYLVEYTDGGTGNDPRHAGYISWTPKGPFDRAYLRMDTPEVKLEGAELHHLPPHVQRLVGEYVLLMDKYTKLGAYLARERGADDLMTEQYSVMGHYAALLKARIDRSIC